MRAVEGPDDGHTFRLHVLSRMSSTIVGEEHHTDAPNFGRAALTLDVRAFDLPAALRKAAALPLAEWEHVDLTDVQIVAMHAVRTYGDKQVWEAACRLLGGQS